VVRGGALMEEPRACYSSWGMEALWRDGLGGKGMTDARSNGFHD
jgi:hypothetical protein